MGDQILFDPGDHRGQRNLVSTNMVPAPGLEVHTYLPIITRKHERGCRETDKADPCREPWVS